MAALGKNRVDAEAFVETNLKRYWNWFLEELDSQRSRGITPYFSVANSKAKSFAVRHEELVLSADAATSRRGELYRSRPPFLTQIATLTDRQYEALSCLTCRHIGAANVHLTPPGSEGGIDFVATIRLSSQSHIFSSAGRDFRVVGQSKKYGTKVTVDRIDQFLRTMENVRSRSTRVSAHLPAWFDVSAGPIVGWIIAHSGYQSGSADEAKKHGLVLSDTLDVAESLTLAESFHAAATPVARAAQVGPACDAIVTEFTV